MSRVLWFHPRPVLPPHGGGQVRTLGLLASVVEAGHEVMLVQPAGPSAAGYPEGLEVVDLALRRGVARLAAKLASRYPLRSPRATRSSLRAARAMVERFRPDVCLVSDVLAWSIVAPVLPVGVPYVYDAHNVETDLYRSFRDEARTLSERLTFGIDHRRMARVERQVTADAAALVAVTEDDATRFVALAPVARLLVVPSSVPTPVTLSTPAAAGRVVLFVGTLDYPPNTAALEELVERTLPALREHVEDARLVVVGRRPPRRLRSLLESTSWCELREGVPDLAPSYHEARCVLLPIRAGGGSRLKVYEALSYGVPVIGTTLALSGVPVVNGVDALISDDPRELVRHAAEVLRDNDRARALGAAGADVFRARLAWSRVSEPLLDLLDEVSTVPA